MIKAGQKVLDARALHPERSLAEHYNPLAMAPQLVKAHDVLDRKVDKAMGAPRKLTSERQRLEILFANYARLIRG
ncbi:type IIL restriction-modification enzyme MmeI [Corynebacterium phoceense]|uniref:type IIL restriction-modification enzyme MmeI n=1 Tax=Corynebacterium TaxID=1716 RepID=UPI002852EC57|nr:type IIL restriction-modification enzyme MmeI [Corynebacterium phoceense]